MRKHPMSLFAAAAGLALVGASLSACTTGTGGSNDHPLTQEQIDQFEQMYTFHETTFECETDDLGLVKTVIHAVPAYGPGSDANPKRLNSENISIPLVGTTADELYADSEQQLCIDPF